MSSNDDSTDRSSRLDSPETEAEHLFEVSLDLLCVADPQGYFLQVNPAFERVLGYSREELTSRPIVDFVHPEDRQRTEQILADLSNDETVIGFRNRYICEDGSIVWLEWQSRVSGAEDNRRVYASARDITDLKRAKLERDRLEAKFQKAQKMESVGLLAGGIAHDFNNLLTTILGNTGLILMNLDELDPLRDRAESIQRAASTAADLCEQLLAYAGKGQFDVRPVDLSKVVRETDHLLEASISVTAELDYDLSAQLPSAQLDATQVRQILMNVVQNAFEALEDGHGTIELETGVVQLTRRDLAETYLDDGLNEGEYVYLEVSDDGMGMSSEKIRRIFDPFYTTKFAGRGLGLAATLGIVRAHDGTVSVESSLDQGTTFRFYFPALETTQPFSDGTEPPPTPKLEAETVLVADDNPEIRDFVEHTLRSEDLAVLKSVDGEDAIEAFRHHHDEISAVLLDMTMPGIETREVVDEVRELSPETPVILSSGYTEEASTEELETEEFGGFLRKPYGPQELLRILADALYD